MQILATVSNMSQIGAVVDLNSGAISWIPVRPEFIDSHITDSNPCRPFGITWSTETLFIANNKQLLMFDKYFEYQGTHETPLQENTHQLAMREDCVWAVSPRTNSLIGIYPGDKPAQELDIFRQAMKQYEPRESLESDDLKHVNSLLWTPSTLYVAAHNFGPSFIMEFDVASWRLTRLRQDVGGSIHGLALEGEDLFWIDTEMNEVRSSSGARVLLSRPGFARGFAMTREHYVVAISEIRDRKARVNGDAFIQVIERTSGALVAEHCLSGSGNVNDLRLLDAFDLAHGIEPYLAPPIRGITRLALTPH